MFLQISTLQVCVETPANSLRRDSYMRCGKVFSQCSTSASLRRRKLLKNPSQTSYVPVAVRFF